MLSPAVIRQAADLLKKGLLVAFPTETVYGLGADASNAEAVQAVFRVKGRPGSHPLIVHIEGAAHLKDWAAEVPPEAFCLAERFWPGPLTLVLPKADRVLSVVTGGQATVGVRVPSHPTALALLREFGGGVAAPSANRFGRVSPTTAEHVRLDLGSDVDLILDDGPCPVGVESTIVRMGCGPTAILRPGGVPREAVEEAVGRSIPILEASPERVPGQLGSHYAPRARVVVVTGSAVERTARELAAEGRRVAVLTPEDVRPEALYASLRRADRPDVDVIVAPLPEGGGLGEAVADRLRKAAGPRG